MTYQVESVQKLLAMFASEVGMDSVTFKAIHFALTGIMTNEQQESFARQLHQRGIVDFTSEQTEKPKEDDRPVSVFQYSGMGSGSLIIHRQSIGLSKSEAQLFCEKLGFEFNYVGADEAPVFKRSECISHDGIDSFTKAIKGAQKANSQAVSEDFLKELDAH